jgi:hypothetical protein
MNELEKMVWAAAFANEFGRLRDRYYNEPGSKRTVDDISGYGCAETADTAVLKLREAMTDDPEKILLPNALSALSGNGSTGR